MNEWMNEWMDGWMRFMDLPFLKAVSCLEISCKGICVIPYTMNEWMNEWINDIKLFRLSHEDIGAGAAKLNTYA